MSYYKIVEPGIKHPHEFPRDARVERDHVYCRVKGCAIYWCPHDGKLYPGAFIWRDVDVKEVKA